MEFCIYLGFVDGQTDMRFETKSAKEALEFLNSYDHEGSSLGLVITADDNEDIYKLLRLEAQ